MFYSHSLPFRRVAFVSAQDVLRCAWFSHVRCRQSISRMGCIFAEMLSGRASFRAVITTITSPLSLMSRLGTAQLNELYRIVARRPEDYIGVLPLGKWKPLALLFPNKIVFALDFLRRPLVRPFPLSLLVCWYCTV